MGRSICRLLIYVNHALVANFNVADMSFNAIRENKILMKISELTVITGSILTLNLAIYLSGKFLPFFCCIYTLDRWQLKRLFTIDGRR